MRHGGQKEHLSKDMLFGGKDLGSLGQESGYDCPKAFAEARVGGPSSCGPWPLTVCDLRQKTGQNRDRMEFKGEALL